MIKKQLVQRKLRNSVSNLVDEVPVNRTDSCWNLLGIWCSIWNVFIYFFFFFVTLSHERVNNWKPLSHKIRNEKKKIWTYKISTRKNFGSTKYEKKFRPKKYPREKISDPRRLNGTMACDQRNLEWKFLQKMGNLISSPEGFA